MPLRPSPRLAASAALGLALAVTAACGDNDDNDADADAVPVEACVALVGLPGALAGDPAAAGPAFEAFTATAPDPLADEAATIVAAYDGLFEGGDPSALSEPDFVDASGVVADAYFAGCATSAELDVEGVDFGFDGLPEEISAGRVAIRFTNGTDTDEPHELVLFRRLAGADESPEELFALPDEELFSKLAMTGVVFADAPGTEAVAMLDLEPGAYIAVCTLPVGGAEGGPPHFAEGMVAELTAA